MDAKFNSGSKKSKYTYIPSVTNILTAFTFPSFFGYHSFLSLFPSGLSAFPATETSQ